MTYYLCPHHVDMRKGIYSLACSCRLNRINTFEYFTDVLNRLAHVNPNAPDEVFREMLPNRWMKK